jgi:hypothetical protein
MSIQNNHKILLINLTLALIPVSFILGNLILNLNIIILISLTLLFYGFAIFGINLNIIDKLIILFFLYIIFNGIFNNFFNFKFANAPSNLVIFKSISYLRFLFLYFVIRFLIDKDLLNYKIIFLTFGLCSLFVSIDVIIQYSFGKDIFGYPKALRRLSGPFGDEAIAGSFIQRFFIFIPFAILFFVGENKKILTQILFTLTLIISCFGLFLAGNRIPLLLFVLMLPMITVYEKNFRKTLLVSIIISILGSIYIMNNSIQTKFHYNTFVTKSSELLNYLKHRVATGEIKGKNNYIKEFETGILTWEKNVNFGGGIKSFRWNCSTIDREKLLDFVTHEGGVNCNNHPHNYYIEIASELGRVGLIIISLIIILIMFDSIKKLHFSKISNEKKMFLVPFFIVLTLEFFPLRTSGSFFSTINANYIFIILPFLVGLLNYKEKFNE